MCKGWRFLLFFVTCILLLLGFFLQNIYEGLWKMRGWMDWGRLEREGIDINEDKHTKYFLVHFRVLCFASFVFIEYLLAFALSACMLRSSGMALAWSSCTRGFGR